MSVQIKNVEQLISQCIGPNKKVTSPKVSRLTAPGENYLSLVLKVEATILNEENGTEEQFSGVAKCLNPPTEGNENFLEFGKMTYVSELVFYTKILPMLQKFVEERGLKRDFDIFPKLLAYRPNLHGQSDEVDMDSVLLLENLAVNGFSNIDRHVGFSYEQAQVVLKDMALFHAVPIALKLKKKHLYEKKLQKLIDRNPFGSFPEPKKGEEPKPPPMNDFEVYTEILETYEQCKLYVSRLKEKSRNLFESMKEARNKPKPEPFSTLCHNDSWVNNTMQKIEDNKIVKNKFVDFQTYSYDTAGQDLIFFIGSSVQLPVLEKHFDDLITFYYINFIEILQELGCDTKAFSRDRFDEELKTVAIMKIHHILMFNKVIYGKKGEVAAMPGVPLRKEDITDIMRERAAYLLFRFGKNGWI